MVKPTAEPWPSPVVRSTAGSRAYDLIRACILSGRFAPGDRLKEDELRALCGVSRTPIREALRRLGTEGLVTDNPHHGVQVVVIRPEDIEEIYALRAMVESHAAARAATRIDAAGVARLKALTEAMQDAIGQDGAVDHEQFMLANAQFHRFIWEAAMSPRLAHMASLVVEAPLVSRTLASYAPEDRVRSVVHHRELIAAFEARNPEWAAAVMGSHIHAAAQALTRSLAAPPVSGAG